MEKPALMITRVFDQYVFANARAPPIFRDKWYLS